MKNKEIIVTFFLSLINLFNPCLLSTYFVNTVLKDADRLVNKMYLITDHMELTVQETIINQTIKLNNCT